MLLPNWFTTVTTGDTSWDAVVKTYPNVHKDYRNWSTGVEPLVSSFASIRSSFAHRVLRARGMYNLAYDLWLNGVPGEHEVMIWTDNNGQVPAGTLHGPGHGVRQDVDLFASASNAILTFRPSGGALLTSGSLDLEGVPRPPDLIGQDPARTRPSARSATASRWPPTHGEPATFEFTEFSISDVR